MPVHDWTRVSPNKFHDFHTAWLSEIRKAPNRGVLPDDYLAALEQSSGDAVPDVITLHKSDPEPPLSSGNGGAGTVAVAEHPPQVDVVASVQLFPARQKRIAIQHASGEVVAIIELVSPGNKRNLTNLREFQDKIAAAIHHGIHVLVLDILPPRKHDPQGIHGVIWDAIGDGEYQRPNEKPLTLASYEAGEIVDAYVQPLSVGDVLPSMPLFLRRGRYVRVPLEATYQEAWDGSPRQWRQELTDAH